MQQPLVSIVTPTFGREAFLPSVAACVRSQVYENVEWLVLDDSERPSSQMKNDPWEKLKYFHSTERLSVGQKRNKLLELASGEIIVHFDDDDFYGANYVDKAVSFLDEKDLDLILLSGFFVAHLDVNSFGYYRTLVKNGPAYTFNQNGVGPVNLGKINIPWIHLCYGWSYVYKRAVWERIKFAELNVFEDREFVRAAIQAFKSGSYECKSVDCMHSVHKKSSSQCFPQFLIPDFVVKSLSPEALRHVAWLKDIVADRNHTGGGLSPQSDLVESGPLHEMS